MNGEDGERLAVQGSPGPEGKQGKQGEQGSQGEQGTAGLSRTVRQALVFLFVLPLILSGANLLWTAHEVHSSQAAIQAAQHREEVLQQRAGVILGEKLCTTFGRLAANKPPAGNPRKNPSRAYDQNQHAILDELGTDLGCKAA